MSLGYGLGEPERPPMEPEVTLEAVSEDDEVIKRMAGEEQVAGTLNSSAAAERSEISETESTAALNASGQMLETRVDEGGYTRAAEPRNSGDVSEIHGKTDNHLEKLSDVVRDAPSEDIRRLERVPSDAISGVRSEDVCHLQGESSAAVSCVPSEDVNHLQRMSSDAVSREPIEDVNHSERVSSEVLSGPPSEDFSNLETVLPDSVSRAPSEDVNQFETVSSDTVLTVQQAPVADGVSEAGETTDKVSEVGGFELSENVVVLRTKSVDPGGQCTVFLVGTAHVSQESCNEVQAVIRHVKPQVVFLELCSSRVAMLIPQKLKVPTFEEMIDMWRRKGMNAFGIVYSWFLAKVADKMEVFPGSEFRVAYEEGLACGARITLGDRPVQVTLKRTWVGMNTWQKAKLMFAMIFQGFFMPSAEELTQLVEEMKDTDMITAIVQEMSKTFPTLMDTLLNERDLYMAAMLQGVAQKYSKVVAVVGKGHLQGIAGNWEKDISIEALMSIPKRKPSFLTRPGVRWGTVAVTIGGLAIYAGVYFRRKS